MWYIRSSKSHKFDTRAGSGGTGSKTQPKKTNVWEVTKNAGKSTFLASLQLAAHSSLFARQFLRRNVSIV